MATGVSSSRGSHVGRITDTPLQTGKHSPPQGRVKSSPATPQPPPCTPFPLFGALGQALLPEESYWAQGLREGKEGARTSIAPSAGHSPCSPPLPHGRSAPPWSPQGSPALGLSAGPHCPQCPSAVPRSPCPEAFSLHLPRAGEESRRLRGLGVRGRLLQAPPPPPSHLASLSGKVTDPEAT